MSDQPSLLKRFNSALEAFPCVAILRGLVPENALEIGQVLYDAGFRIIEVPLNSITPLKSIKILAEHFGDDVIIGAGTVLTPDEVDKVHAAGGRVIVSPNCNPSVILRTKALGMISAPGVLTPTEAFMAIDHGADCLKFFPGEIISPTILKAMKAVLPPDMPCIVVGGISDEKMESFFDVGATGFGLGSSIFKAGDDASMVAIKAKAIRTAIERIS